MQNISPFQDATHVRLIFHFDKEGAWSAVLDRFMRDARAHASGSVAGNPQRLAPPPHVLAACPALRYFFVTVAGRDDAHVVFASAPRGWIHTRAWRVVEATAVECRNSATARSGKVLEEVSEDAARRVIEAEDLGLPEEWEVRLPVMLQRDTPSCNNARRVAEVGGMSERLKHWVRAVECLLSL